MFKSALSFLCKPWLRRLLGGLVLLVIVACAGAAFYINHALRSSLPVYSGQITLPKLTGAVSVVRDTYGVPHIFANSRANALRALGYVHASERFFQMEMQRRAGQGRLSEAVGSDMLGVDKFIRTLGLYGLAQSSFLAMKPETKALFIAYTEGVNGWLAANRNNLSLEFKLLNITPEAWQPTDSVVWGKLMALQLSKNMEFEKLRATLAAKSPAIHWQALFPNYFANDTPVTISPKQLRNDKTELKNTIDYAMQQLGSVTALDHGASNEWVVGGAYTASGKPILANDPHLGLEAPILWYLVRMTTPWGELRGATVPGLPIVLLGQNSSIAWGFTTAGSDVQDVFVETVDKNDSTSYLTPNGKEKFITRTERIIVKNGLDVELKVRATRHGPVLSDIDEELAYLVGPGKVAALGFTGLGDKDTTAEALLRINQASNWDEFLAALQLYQSPVQNIVYADRAGNIGYMSPGLIPVRKSGDGTSPVDGASGGADWIGMIPFSQLPQVYNPAAGYLFNANNAVASPGLFYKLGVDWEESYRARRIQQLFNTIRNYNLDTAAAMQADHVSLVARDLLPRLLAVKSNDARSVEAEALLSKWDGTMDRNRPEPLIFDAWLYQLNQILFTEGLGNPLKAKGPLKASLLAGILGDPSSEFCSKKYQGDGVSSCNAVIMKALDRALTDLTSRRGHDMARWRWGDEHRAILTHKVFSHVPILKDWSDLSVPSSGDFYTLDRGGSFDMKEPHLFARTHGGGFRGIYDLADPKQSRFMITTGESGHILSPHYGDLVPLWNDVKSITLTGTREELLKRGGQELWLLPPGASPSH